MTDKLMRRYIQLPEGPEATARRIRRFRRVRNQLLVDRGGEPTQAQETLADNAAALAVYLEEEATRMMHGTAVELSQVNGSMNTLRRLLETLGIERRPKDITTLTQYIGEQSKRNDEHNSGH